jgi:D-alanyl-D-alanine carboxypeptidase
VSDYALTRAAGAPGITAAVLTDHGSWAGAAGTGGDGAQLTPQAMMAIHSITKTFVAAEVMRLAEMGKVDLDAPLSTYIRHSLTANGATVRQTLSMRSGLIDPPDTALNAMVGTKASVARRRWTALEVLAALKPHSSPPGGIPVYSNTNYLLLGLLVEKVTGRTLAQVERADLFTPAGLSRVAAQDAERPVPPLAAPPGRLNAAPDGYLPNRSWARLGFDSFAGIAADAPTVARWGYQLYGARLLSAKSVLEMTTQPSQDSIFPGVGYGLGTMTFTGLGTDAAYGHTGEWQG